MSATAWICPVSSAASSASACATHGSSLLQSGNPRAEPGNQKYHAFSTWRILAYADVQIPAKADQSKAVETIQSVAKGMWAQFGAIILSEPVFGKVETTPGN